MPKQTNIDQAQVIARRQSIGEQIFFNRHGNLMTVEQLAEAVGVEPKTIDKIENGQFDFKVDLLIRIGIVLEFKINLI